MNQAGSFLEKYIKSSKSPCVQYKIFDKDSLLYEYRGGLAKIDTHTRTNESTTFNLYSVTKTFTALAILQLTEQGKLDINMPIKNYLPEFPYGPGITIKQILNHTGGIPNPIPLNWIHLDKEHDSFDRNKFFKIIFEKNSKTKAMPNEKYIYSNLGYVLIGQAIEKITGQSYEDYITINIIRKLNIQPEELSFSISHDGRHAKGYSKKWSLSYVLLGCVIDKAKYMDKTEGIWKSFKNFYVNGAPYGGLIGNSRSLVRYIQELLSGAVLLREASKELYFDENHTNDGTSTGMCLSWFCGELKGNRYFTHPGGGGGYYCEIRIYPSIGIGSVILFNRTGMTDERFLDKVDKYFI